jgi:hypothetical protein
MYFGMKIMIKGMRFFVFVALFAIGFPNIASATTPELYYNNPMNQSG